MGIRLNKVLTELNIGLQTAIDYLKNKTSLGEVRDDATPNTKISDQQYEALVEAFSTDKAVKTQADKLFPKKNKEKKPIIVRRFIRSLFMKIKKNLWQPCRQRKL